MAQIPYAAGARITDFALTPQVPGQISHPLPATGGLKVFNTGHGLWHGVVRFGVRKGGPAAEIAAMLASLNGAQNWLELPWRAYPTIDAASRIAGTLGSIYTVAVVDGLARGAFVRSGGRVFVVSAMPAANQVQLWPTLPLGVGARLEPVASIRARSRDGNSPDLPATPHWHGPWVWNWQEYIE